MKSNLLVLAVTVLFALGLSSFALAGQDPNDHGVADTLYLDIWPGDDVLHLPGPWDVRCNLRVTNDIPDPSIDSIASIVIPLCFTSSNAAANATIAAAKNHTNLYPFPDLDNSIFQHLPDMTTRTVENWMMVYSESLMGEEWDTRILDLGGGTHFWLSLVPTGTQDKRFPGGSRLLTATMTFTTDDSTTICIDTCFWPPAGRLVFYRSDAVTYIPQIWDDYLGEEYYCFSPFIVPNIPPIVTCPGDQSHHMNGSYTASQVAANDPDGTIPSATVSFTGPGVANVVLVNEVGLGTPNYTADVSYDVVDHCQAGGTVTVTVIDDDGATSQCTFNITLVNNPPIIICPNDDSVTAGNLFVSTPFFAIDPDGDPLTVSVVGINPPPVNTPTIVGDHVEWQTLSSEVGSYIVTLGVEDPCGVSGQCSFNVKCTTFWVPSPGPGKLFAGVTDSGHVCEWAGGTKWDSITTTPLGYSVLCLALYYGTLFAGTMSDQNIYFSEGKVHKYDWDTRTWTQVGQPLDNAVNVLVVYKGILYAGTSSQQGANLYSLDRTTWRPSLNLLPPWSGIRSAYVWKDWLYLGDHYSDLIARFDGTNCYEVHTTAPLWGGISDFVDYQNALYASCWGGGMWATPNGVSWDPMWADLPDFRDIWKMETFRDSLYFGTSNGTALDRRAWLCESDGQTYRDTIWTPSFLDQGRGIISMATSQRLLLLGLGKEATYTGVGGVGKVYAWNGNLPVSDSISLISVPHPINRDLGRGVQVLLWISWPTLVMIADGVAPSWPTPPSPKAPWCVNPGDYVCLPILLDNNTTPFGGFELEVEFDYTSMTFVGAEPGELIEGFEKFTYRLLPCPACGCCKYKILLYGQYDMPNGVENFGDPIPMTPPGEYRELVNLCFVVNNDENLRGLTIPVCWEWEGTVVNDTLVEDWECSENTFSSWSGDTLYTSSLLCQFNPNICDDPTDRIQPVLIFQDGVCGQNCGGVDVCPAGPGECKRGDINFNTMTYEVADAVLFASYFVEGTSVFRYDEAYQVCATDVNADGRTLTLSDLVYLIRVILHDAVAIPKLTPSDEVANVIVSGGTISTECAAPIGAILFEFDGAVSPTLLADMEMVYKDNKILVWSSKGKSFSTAEVLSFAGEAELVTATAVDRDSRELATSITGKVAPLTFALHPAYPNPFNVETQIRFDLPTDCRVTLKVYNISGQLVKTLADQPLEAGRHTISWDGTNQSGNTVASGVYFYKLTAGRFSATEKMVMMK